ncbi:4-hydroxythreonine-4-phosphate dehydrogenase PdxA [Rhodocytophaga aerolata]|uniref:4-hydroxythreonine-4-phosphate dehydrogenase PdxA n=1 Tax=Rhodocytophaga aerolata TaxID=455078 RepID=A0ABT8R904_9BACT|nr:4-hydroxythreonine-4-phosphate dehydrogenase PdxA [Rhodocytophaga aerolata]MDO1447703.1 4-hydroxythreonine-4-phosphate dehydrogenase PdxA [Rhodocytophaga aerolata]
MSEHKPIIGITLGDFNGVGPEVTLKALSNNTILKMCTPVIYGSVKVLSKYRKLLNLEEWTLHPVKSIDQISPKRTNVLNCWNENLEIQPGKVTAEAGQNAFIALKSAVADLQNKHIDAIVTAPINKFNIQNEEFKFAGHTEYFTQSFGVQDSLMLLVSEGLRVGVVTGHIPLGAVKESITKEKIISKATILLQTLKRDFGIQKPKIALLGLNPHAGEEGLLGNEEQEIITPVIQELKHKGNMVFGPFPADGFFGTMSYKKYDAVLAMYHDQGLIPFKTIAFESGVNYTAGLPIVRTSPDHGTAYNISGKNVASETSMREAIFLAIDIVNMRKEVIAV